MDEKTIVTAPEETKEVPDAENPILSSEEIRRLIQKTVDSRTADFGKKISELQRENANLKKANMTAEELQKAEREEFERSKAEVELAKRQIYAQGIVCEAGFGNDVAEVVNLVIGKTDDETSEKLTAFKGLVDKIVAKQVEATFKSNGRIPNGGNSAEEKKTGGIAEKIGKERAEQAKRSDEVMKFYLGGKK